MFSLLSVATRDGGSTTYTAAAQLAPGHPRWRRAAANLTTRSAIGNNAMLITRQCRTFSPFITLSCG